jgi:predicted O-methyltransferase YrrM
MKSSYLTNHYGDLVRSLVRIYDPKKIVEFGILDGFSLRCILSAVHVAGDETKRDILAYDIFEDFPYHHAKHDTLREEFGEIIQYGDYYKKYEELEDESIDFLHIDIANTGLVYNFFFRTYIHKLSKRGIALLEGGSRARDSHDWMLKFEKPPMAPVLDKYKDIYNIFVLEPFPSVTLVSWR